ncbi:MAG: hypothetical protein ABR568_03115 [Pyrinomonadaceae bacterium]
MRNHHPVLHLVASSLSVVAVFLLMAICIGPVAADQSGRRASKSSSAPAPTPTPHATPVEKKPAAETRAPLSFIVGIDREAGFAIIPMYFYDSVLRAFADRLDDSTVKVTVANREMNRGEAVKRAKAEAESQLVWMQLRFDTASMNDADLREVYIDYWVFAPTTAKTVANGRSYQQMYRGGGVIVMPRPGGRTSEPYAEQLLKQAARDAAERVLSALNLPGRRVPG